ncbi:MAG: NADH-quinone oxidoreductase subunit NuoK, partial [Spirosomataceae bacterium]
MIPLHYYLLTAAMLFSLGLATSLLKKQAIFVLMGIELMLNAVNINFVAFSQYDPNFLQGQMFSLFVIVVAAAEVTVALAIVIRLYSHYKTTRL